MNDGDLLYKNCIGDICQSSFGIHKSVKFLAISVSEETSKNKLENSLNLIYGTQTLNYHRKKYLSIMSPQKHKEMQLIQKEYEFPFPSDI